jgi:hypothetical protein
VQRCGVGWVGMLGVVQVRGSWRVNPADLWCAIGGELILSVTRLRARVWARSWARGELFGFYHKRYKPWDSRDEGRGIWLL